MMTATPTLDHLDAQQLRELATRLMAEMRVKQVLIDKLTHEMATLKRLKFAAASEAYRSQSETQHRLDVAVAARVLLLRRVRPAYRFQSWPWRMR
jgi:hypothetical protein